MHAHPHTVRMAQIHHISISAVSRLIDLDTVGCINTKSASIWIRFEGTGFESDILYDNYKHIKEGDWRHG